MSLYLLPSQETDTPIKVLMRMIPEVNITWLAGKIC